MDVVYLNYIHKQLHRYVCGYSLRTWPDHVFYRKANTVVGVVYKTTPTRGATVVGVTKSYGCYIKLWVYVRLK